MFYAIDSAATLSDKEVKWRFFDFLYKYKTNVDLPMPNKQTKLMQYVQNGRLDIVKKLVSYNKFIIIIKKMKFCVCVLTRLKDMTIMKNTKYMKAKY